MASGSPWESQIRWHLLPGLARSVGLGPVCRPQKQHELNNCPRPPVTNQSARSGPASPATRSGTFPRCPPLANHVIDASRSSPNRTAVPAEASPTVSRCARQTECRLDKRGLVNVVGLPWAWAARRVTRAESDSTKHREPKKCSWIEHPSTWRAMWAGTLDRLRARFC